MNKLNTFGIHLMTGFAGQALDDAERTRLIHAAPGGVILFRRNIASSSQVKELTAALRAAAKEYMDEPLLIAVDHEGGAVHRFGPHVTRFPSALAVGASQRPDLAEQMGRAMAAELLPLGITVDFAPVVDLLSDRSNPQVLTRSFSDDPAAAGALAAGFIRGAQQAGLAATAKHFPGLGDCRIDSHIDLPRIPHHSSRFRTLELTPFRAAIAAGAALVMTAHVAVPGLTGDDCPASLSRVVITDLLRGELGFSGVVVSDALEMGGISRQMNVPEAAVRALHAGTDIALCCRSAEDLAAVLAALRTAVADGRLPEEELAASRERIQRLRQRFGAPRAQPVALAKSPADLSRQIANRAVWRRQDPAGLLPITSSDPPWQALWLGRAMGSAVSDQEPLEAQPLIKRLAEAGIRTEAIENLAAAAPDKPLLVLETNLHLEPHCSEVVDKLAGHSAPVLLVSFEVPLPQQLVPANITALAVFHGSQICQLAAADVLLGCERPLGRSPFAADGYLA